MRFSPGCGCCCVSLVVDNDNTDYWTHSDVSGVETVTINKAVSLCNFLLLFSIDKPARNVSNYYSAAWDGLLTIYFLDDPSDANVDAIGSITFTGRETTDTSSPWARNEAFPFYWPSGSTSSFSIPEAGDGDVDIPDMGMLSASYKCDGVSYTYGTGTSGRLDLLLASFDNVLLFGKQLNTSQGGTFNSGTTSSPATTDSFNDVAAIFNRTGCTEKDVYLRYVLEDDFNLDTTGTKFTLQTLNELGDDTCRTDSSYYNPDPESGNCESPPALCDVTRSRQIPFATVDFEIEHAAVFSGTQTGFSWAFKQTLVMCDFRTFLIINTVGGGFGTIYFYAELTLTCDAGVMMMDVTFFYFAGTPGTYEESTWSIELPYSVTHPNEIPTTTLNEANSATWGFSGDSATLTINA